MIPRICVSRRMASLLLAATMGVLVAACAQGPATSSPHLSAPPADPDALARRLGAPTVAPEDDCAAEVKNNVFPDYPPDALKKNIEGWALVRYDLDGSGKASSVRVLASQPQGVFDEAATRSVARTTYLAGAVRTGCKARITFGFRKP